MASYMRSDRGLFQVSISLKRHRCKNSNTTTVSRIYFKKRMTADTKCLPPGSIFTLIRERAINIEHFPCSMFLMFIRVLCQFHSH